MIKRLFMTLGVIALMSITTGVYAKDTQTSLTVEMHLLMQNRNINDLSRAEAAQCVDLIDRWNALELTPFQKIAREMTGDTMKIAIMVIRDECEKQTSWFRFLQ